MRDRMTSIYLSGHHASGLSLYGKKTVPEMVDALRKLATHQKAEAEAILAAAPDDFRVETFLGIYARAGLKVLQKGSA